MSLLPPTTTQAEAITLAPGVALTLLEIPGGPFQIGEEDNSLTGKIDTFWLGQYPVTNAQYLAFMNATNSNAPQWMEETHAENIYTGTEDYYKQMGEALTAPNHPVVGVSWDNAVAFCEWLSMATGQRYALPSEVQWEYTARGGQLSKGFPYAGGYRPGEVAWYDNNSPGTTMPVGLKLPNELDLFDMSGNVLEWCADHWHDNYEGTPQDGRPWLSEKEETLRVIRGGSWSSHDNRCRVSFRVRNDHDYRSNFVGFRVARY
ncbi:MAG: formylglycine-generating enzyme family protein [Bacteroidota bacterium]